ncbi:serine hydrolase [Microtetraspora fusca]|uniref:serine hydrolase n=1 Tax=Microtetraspora fusca TaxID=1997 RepID=UPI0012F970A9
MRHRRRKGRADPIAHAAPTAAPPRWPDTAPAGPRPDLHRGLGGSPARPGHGSRTRRDRHRKEGRKRPQSLLAWCRYSNTDYILLGLIVEKLTRQSLADVFHQRVFAPFTLIRPTCPETRCISRVVTFAAT